MKRERWWKRYSVLILILAAVMNGIFSISSSAATDSSHLLILMDLSYSMSRKMGKMTRIDAARKVFAEVLAGIPDDTVLGLRLFSHLGDSDEKTACQESELVVPFQKGAQGKIIKIIKEKKPVGQKTPLAYALTLAQEDLKGVRGEKKIILLSDGEETCQGNPEKLAEELQDLEIRIDAIGIGDEGSFAQLGGIALAGGGKFYLGSNFESLKEALIGSLGGGKSPGLAREMDEAASEPGSAADQGPPLSLVKVIALPADETDRQKTEDKKKESEPSAPAISLEIILDASGSMAGKLKGETKIRLAKQALKEIVRALDSKLIRLAFRAYGFDASIEKTREKSCKNTELLVGFSSNNASAIIDRAGSLTAYGYTPIAESLRLAGEDLKPYRDNQLMVLLISDGEETCGGDPVGAITKLREAGIDVSVHVVGFDLDKNARTQLQAVAQAGKGQYYDANNYPALIESLKMIVDEVWNKVAEIESERFIHPVAGGADLEDAPILQPGRYTLKDHLAKGERVYFFVPTSRAQRGVLQSRIQTHALVKDRKGEVKEAAYAISGITIDIYGPDKKKIKGRRARAGEKIGKSALTHYMDTDGEGFYFSVGDDYNAVHKDALFALEIEEAGDAYNGWEAPEKPRPAALTLRLGEEITAHLGLEDRGDSYKLEGIPAVTKTVPMTIVFTDPEYRFKVEVYDKAAGKQIQRYVKLKGKAELDIPVIAGNSVLIIRIVDGNPRLYHIFSSYKLRIGR